MAARLVHVDRSPLAPFVADGQARKALLHVPARPAAGRGYPALVAFPGYSTQAADFARFSGLSAKADASGFIAVYPQALGDPPEWHLSGGLSLHPEQTASDHALAASILDWLAAGGCVDAGRIFLAGHSQGGGMVADLSCELSRRIAGVGLVSGVYVGFPCEPPHAIPVVAFHALDDVLPYKRGHAARRRWSCTGSRRAPTPGPRRRPSGSGRSSPACPRSADADCRAALSRPGPRRAAQPPRATP